ncbi:hypothetical protein RirG_130000 [Rhizophagus irregularis DAOM 197198w]|uniref:Uncharacterized protein n=1 Tax=Rhizophagus irregularis (strain DAOM 197198w) TaxID=1432141 RepID=A0A015J887_RHIIW|nr:hypothetical protein RirG_130000 [Rhizophagus irregularis DAOM 197198w]
MPLPQSLKPQSLSPSPFLSFETTPNSSLISDEITSNLYICCASDRFLPQIEAHAPHIEIVT